MKADIEGYLNEADKLAEERSVLIEQVEDAQRGWQRNAQHSMICRIN